MTPRSYDRIRDTRDSAVQQSEVSKDAYVRSRGRIKEKAIMAKNGKPGAGRVGAVRNRSQVQNPRTNLWVKRDLSSGRFLEAKAKGGSFKGVRRER